MRFPLKSFILIENIWKYGSSTGPFQRIYALSSTPEKENKKFRNLSSEEKVSLELLLTDAFFRLAHDLENGKVNPSSLDPNWKFEEKETENNYSEMLKEVAGGRVELK